MSVLYRDAETLIYAASGQESNVFGILERATRGDVTLEPFSVASWRKKRVAGTKERKKQASRIKAIRQMYQHFDVAVMKTPQPKNLEKRLILGLWFQSS